MTQQLDNTFAALADPTRRAILARLAGGEATAGELAAPFAISALAVSRHLKVLENAQLIDRTTDAQWRRCRLNPAGLKTASDWLSQYRQFWEEQLDALADYLNYLQESGDKSDGNGSKSNRSSQPTNGRKKRG